jgi:hypothetical protein
MIDSFRSLHQVVVLVALTGVGCGGAKAGDAKSADDEDKPWSAPADDSANASGAGGDGKWSPYDDSAAGIHAELPCRAPTTSTSTSTTGPIRFEQKNVTCVVGASKFTLSYWTSMDLDPALAATGDPNAIKSAVEPTLMSWVEAPQRDGFTIVSKDRINSQPGWVGFEIRSSHDDMVRTDRHYLLMPRHVTTIAVGPQRDASDHDRFAGSLQIKSPGDAPAGLSEHTVDFGGATFTLTLPCTPDFKPDAEDDDPDGRVMSREFDCRHPSANLGYSGQISRYENPAAVSPAERRVRSTKLAAANASIMCQMFAAMLPQAGACNVGPTQKLGATGAEVDIQGSQLAVRVLVDYPYMAMLAVIGDPSPDTPQVLSGLKLPSTP